MNRNSVKIAILIALLALAGWASSNLAADSPDATQKEMEAIKTQLTQLQKRVDQLETRVEKLSQPQLHPAGRE